MLLYRGERVGERTGERVVGEKRAESLLLLYPLGIRTVLLLCASANLKYPLFPPSTLSAAAVIAAKPDILDVSPMI